jgi:hypothetical protein
MSVKVRRIAAPLLGVILWCTAVGVVPLDAWAGAEVSRYAFAPKIVAKEPVGVATSFPSDVGNLYFFTQITGADRNAELLHVWIYDGEEVAIVPIDVQGSPWRTWSARTIDPAQRGDWTVEVREVGGKLLASATCRIE